MMHSVDLIECPFCGEGRDLSGVGPPCCVAQLTTMQGPPPLRYYVPADGDPAEVRLWVGGHGSNFIYFDANDESVIIGIPDGCTLATRIGDPGPHHEPGEWSVTYEGVTLETGKLTWRIIP